jgi:hypothetical protein
MQGFSADRPVLAAMPQAAPPQDARQPGNVNLLIRFVRHPMQHALLCDARRPHGHPPLILEAASGGLFFSARAAQLRLAGRIGDVTLGVDRSRRS